MSDSCDRLARVVREKFEKIGFKDVNVTLVNYNNAGDGYLSDIVRANVTATKNGAEQEIDAVIKTATKDAKVRSNVPTAGAFKREMFVYTQIVPIYEKLQDDFAIEKRYRLKFPKCYAVNEEQYDEFIILENLKSQNFALTERLKLDYIHAAAAIKELAKLHTLSFVFERVYPEKFQDIADQCDEVFLRRCDIEYNSRDNEYDPSLMQRFIETCKRKVLNFIKEETHVKKVCIATKNLWNLMITLGKGGSNKVILHGDYWTNNIFYKNTNGDSLEVVPIDYQMTRYGSPVNDISYLICSSTEADFRRDHYQQLLEHYYSCLSESLKLFSYDVEDVYPKEIFWKEVSEHSIFGLAFSFIFMVNALEPENGTNFIENCEKAHKYETIASPVFEKRVNELITDYVSYGYI